MDTTNITPEHRDVIIDWLYRGYLPVLLQATGSITIRFVASDLVDLPNLATPGTLEEAMGVVDSLWLPIAEELERQRQEGILMDWDEAHWLVERSGWPAAKAILGDHPAARPLKIIGILMRIQQIHPVAVVAPVRPHFAAICVLHRPVRHRVHLQLRGTGGHRGPCTGGHGGL